MFVLPLLRENKTPGCPIQRVLENDFVVVTGTGTARDFIRLLTVELPLFAMRRPGVRIPSRPPSFKELNRLFGIAKVCQVCHLRPPPLPAGGRAA